jgi:aspartyl aminopeptidase
VGSESTKGADGCFLPDTLERIALAQSLKPEDYKRALANSFMLSVDMAHAYQPNFPAAYELHRPHGIANINATDA